MNDTIKKHANKVLGGTLGAVGIGIMLFFWSLDVSRADLKKIPDTNKHTETMYSERVKVASQLKKVTKSLDSIIIVLGYTNRALEKFAEER